jgi:hypothetical protein
LEGLEEPLPQLQLELSRPQLALVLSIPTLAQLRPEPLLFHLLMQAPLEAPVRPQEQLQALARM